MDFLKRHKTSLVVIGASAQLLYLLSMHVTRWTAVLLVRAILSGHFIPYLLLAPCLLGFGVMFNRKLKALNLRWLEWSPGHVQANLALVPLGSQLFWAPYALLLASCMPLLAMFEEVIFRNGTNNWLRGMIWGVLAFGLVHVLSMVSIRMAIYISLVGAVLVQVYLVDGLMAAFVVHACYNLLALCMIVTEAHLKRAPALLKRASAWVATAS